DVRHACSWTGCGDLRRRPWRAPRGCPGVRLCCNGSLSSAPAMRTTGIVAIAGSLRQGSYNRLLLRAAADRAPAGMTLHLYADLASLPLFNEDIEGGDGPGAARQLRDDVRAADGILIATPEYNQSLPGVLKN